MKCYYCKKVKLSREFPPFVLTDECEHPVSHCLSCVTEYWKDHGTCSKCNVQVPKDSEMLAACFSRMEALYPEVRGTKDQAVEAFSDSHDITVARLNGDSIKLPYNEHMTIFVLRRTVHKKFGIDPNQQPNFMFDKQILQDINKTTSEQNTLGMMNVQPGDTLYLFVRMCTVPTTLGEVVFDLHWGYPESGKDFLDACAWTFDGQKCKQAVRFYERRLYNGAICHSGDVVYDDERRGHHKITVNVKDLPEDITHVFFTLSAYHSTSVSNFQSPSVKLYPADNPEVSLCEDKSYDESHQQALIMCFLEKSDDIWSVHECGTPCDGGAQVNIEPILKSIQSIIAKLGNFPHVELNLVTRDITDPEELKMITARKL